MTNTQDFDAVAEEFSMSKYAHYLERDAALLQEIVDLRKKIVSLQETVDSLEDRYELACTELAGEDY